MSNKSYELDLSVKLTFSDYDSAIALLDWYMPLMDTKGFEQVMSAGLEKQFEYKKDGLLFGFSIECTEYSEAVELSFVYAIESNVIFLAPSRPYAH